MSTTGFFGMKGTGDWATDERPKNFRQGILKIFPNGSTPMTAINSKGSSRRVDDPEFSYFSKDLALQGGALSGSGVYLDAQLTTAVTAATANGVVVYAKVLTTIANHFRPGHTVVMVQDADTTNTTFGKVVSVTIFDSTTSAIGVKLRKAAADGTLELADYIDIVGNAQPEGSFIPDAVSYYPSKFTNYTQIFRTPWDITRTAMKTRYRTGDPVMELKREALQYHGIEMEMAAIFGEKSEATGDNGKPERTTQGLISMIKEHASDNVSNFTTAQSSSWLVAGEDWLDDKFEILFREGRSERLALVGPGALRGVQRIVKSSGQFQISAQTGAYGLKVMEWITPFGVVNMMRHPLMSHKSYLRNSMLLYDPKNMNFSYIDDTTYQKDLDMPKQSGGRIGYDGKKEGWLTEAGYEWHFPETAMYLEGLNEDPA